MNYEHLQTLSIAELKALQLTAADVLKEKTEQLRQEIREQAIAKAVENGIDPESIFGNSKKKAPRKKRASTQKPPQG